jgi:hypothetical protein
MLRKLQQTRDTTHQKDILYRDVFMTPQGKKVLEDLQLQFNPDRLHTDNAHTTAIRVGESTPIRYILRRVENGVDGQSV